MAARAPRRRRDNAPAPSRDDSAKRTSIATRTDRGPLPDELHERESHRADHRVDLEPGGHGLPRFCCRISTLASRRRISRKSSSRRRPRRKCLNDELGSGSTERPVEQIGQQVPLCLVLGMPGAVQMLPPMVFARGQPLLGHHLQRLEGGGVPNASRVGHLVVDFAHRARAARPEHAENRQLRIGRLRHLRHAGSIPTIIIVCQR